MSASVYTKYYESRLTLVLACYSPVCVNPLQLTLCRHNFFTVARSFSSSEHCRRKQSYYLPDAPILVPFQFKVKSPDLSYNQESTIHLDQTRQVTGEARNMLCSFTFDGTRHVPSISKRTEEQAALCSHVSMPATCCAPALRV